MDLHDIIENLHKGKKSVHTKNEAFILNYSQLNSKDLNLVGKQLQTQILIQEEFPNYFKKNGFIITHYALKEMLIENNVHSKILKIVSNINAKNIFSSSNKIQQIISKIEISELLRVQISRQLNLIEEEKQNLGLISKLETSYDTSSITELEQFPLIHKNLSDISRDIIEKLQELYSVSNLKNMIDSNISEPMFCISYELFLENILKSGTVSSIDYKTGHESILSIQSNFGVLSYKFHNTNIPDRYQVFKIGVKESKDGVFEKNTVFKKEYITYSNQKIINQAIPKSKLKDSSLNLEEIKKISQLCINIEDFLTKKLKSYTPIKINFSIIDNNIENKSIIIDEIIIEKKHLNLLNKEIQHYELIENNKQPIFTAQSINHGIIHGKVKHIHNEKDLFSISKDDIVVLNTAKAHFVNHFSNVKGIICNLGNEFSLSSKFCFEHGILGAINCSKNPTEEFKEGEFITLDCSESISRIYRGLLKYKIQQLPKLESHNSLEKQLFEESIPHSLFEKSNFPSNGKMNISLYENTNLNQSIENIKIDVIKNISKIAISRFPHPVYVSISSSNEITNKLASKKDSNEIGIKKAINPDFEKIVKFELDCIKEILKIGCSNISILISNVQEEKEIKKFKELLNKYSIKIPICAQVSMGGIVLSDEISKYCDVIAISLNELRLACNTLNTKAISNYVYFFLENISKKNVKSAILNVDSKDFELLENIFHSKINIISTRHENFLEIYSVLSQIQDNKKIKHSKHKSSKIKNKK